MFDQLLLGSAITFVSLVVGAMMWWVLNELILWMEPWLRRPPYPAKSFVVILMVVLSTMSMMTLGVWLWAFVFELTAVFAANGWDCVIKVNSEQDENIRHLDILQNKLITAVSSKMANRNDPCPCQSGKKYKKCCGA